MLLPWAEHCRTGVLKDTKNKADWGLVTQGTRAQNEPLGSKCAQGHSTGTWAWQVEQRGGGNYDPPRRLPELVDKLT